MYRLKNILQYSNDGVSVEKEIVLHEETGDLEALKEIIEYEFDLSQFTCKDNSYISEWYKVDVQKFPYNRIILRIEKEESPE